MIVDMKLGVCHSHHSTKVTRRDVMLSGQTPPFESRSMQCGAHFGLEVIMPEYGKRNENVNA